MFAGVLAFVRVGFRAFPDPVLYLHPRFDGVLPELLMALEGRSLAEDRAGMVRLQARVEGILAGLGLVPGDT